MIKKDITAPLTQIQLYFNTIVLLFIKTQFHNIYKLNYKISYTKNKCTTLHIYLDKNTLNGTSLVFDIRF